MQESALYTSMLEITLFWSAYQFTHQFTLTLGLRIKRDSNATLELSVGKEKLIPEVLDESDEENEKEANKEPTTDVIPESDETKDHQKHEKKGSKWRSKYGIHIIFVIGFSDFKYLFL